MKFNTKKITLMTTLGALYALGSFLPGFPVIGVTESEIDLMRALEISYGFILGPVFGPITAFIGALIGKLLTGGGIFFTPLAIISTLMAASLSRRKVFGIRGWFIAFAILIVLIIGWYSTSTGREAPIYPILHIIGLGIILIFRRKLVDYFHSEVKRQLSIGTALISFPSTMSGQMLGNLITISLFRLPASLFMGLLPVVAVERIVLTILSTIISTSLLLIVRNVFPELIEED